jgi:orotidine-5'-phosphate decarboxylase
MLVSPEIDAAQRIYVAFDYPSIHHEEAQQTLNNLYGTGAGAKIGLEVTAASGWPEPLGVAQDNEFNTFADAKLHDIGNTVWSTAETILRPGPNFLNTHASCSKAALRGLFETRARMQVHAQGESPFTKLLGVTVLTDVEEDEAVSDYRRGRKKQVLYFADKVMDCGFDGVVCSPQELKLLAKYARFDDMVKMVPAIRPKWSVANDQKNFTTPTEAIERGATHIVVGRPITKQYEKIGQTPLDAFQAVLEEVVEAA